MRTAFQLVVLGLVMALLSFGAEADLSKRPAQQAASLLGYTPLVGYTPLLALQSAPAPLVPAKAVSKSSTNRALHAPTIPPDPDDGPTCVCAWYACMVFWPGCFVY